jgi:hypothetical protein
MRTQRLSITAIALALFGTAAYAQTARLQVIHNCADAAASEVDVYLNGGILLDDFAFRTATPFIDAPAGVPLTVGIAPANSMDASESIFTQEFTLADGGSYIVVASGIVSPTGYSPAPAFSLEVFAAARESAEGTGTDVLVYHGSTDAPTVDVFESAVVSTTIVDDLSYMDFAGYLELPTLDFVIQVRTADNTAVVAAYAAPLATLGLQGAALTVLASGFLDPSMNSNGAAFGLYVASPAGGPLLALPSVALPGPARLQVIHNSADAAAAQVDVYLNGALLLDNFAFRTATPFVDVPSGVDLNIGIAPPNSTSAADAIAEFTYVLEEGGTYVVVANGIVSPTGYSPVQPFDLYATAGREAASIAGNTDILVFHGATDAPMVDVAETAVLGGAVIVDDLDYGTFQGYLEVPTLDFVLQVQTTDGTPVVAYQAPLESLGLNDAAIVVLASGFLNPAGNSNGEPFGLYVALPAGGPLVALPLATSITERGNLSGMTAWPNPTNGLLSVSFDLANNANTILKITDMLGRNVLDLGSSTRVAGEQRMDLDLSGLANGSYLLQITSGAEQRTLPVMINR